MVLELCAPNQSLAPQLKLPVMVKVTLNDDWMHQKADLSQKIHYFTCLFQIFRKTRTASQ